MLSPHSQSSLGDDAPCSKSGPSGSRKRKLREPAKSGPTDPKLKMNESPGTKALTPFLYVFGGDHTVESPKGVVERYRFNPGFWEKIAEMPCEGFKVGIRAVRYRNDVWVVGGLFRKNVYTFDKGRGKFFDQKKPMRHARQYLGLVEFQSNLMAIGGEDGGEGTVLGSVEMCQPHLKWTLSDSLNTPRSDFGVSVFKDKIFVAGGRTSTDSRTNSVEMFSFESHWTRARRGMDIARSGFSLVVSVNSIYAIGGDENVSISKCKEGEKWELVSDGMKSDRRRQRGTAVNRGGMFYFVGGKQDGGDTKYLDGFSTKGKGKNYGWRPLSDMYTERSGAAVLIVTLEEILRDYDD